MIDPESITSGDQLPMPGVHWSARPSKRTLRLEYRAMAEAFAAPCLLPRAEPLRHTAVDPAASKRGPTCCAHLSRRAVLHAGALALLLPLPDAATAADAETEAPAAAVAASTADAKVTDRVYFDVKIAGKPRGRLTLGLFGEEAPACVETFKTISSGALKGRGGRRAGYAYSTGQKVVRDRFVELGHVVQIDAINQNAGVAQRQLVQIMPPENRESNGLTHDARGVVSVRRGGGRFEFDIALAEDKRLDKENVVIGRVVGGEEVLEMLGKVPTTQKTARDGFRGVGRVIGDVRAKVDVRLCSSCLRRRYATGYLTLHFFGFFVNLFSWKTRWVFLSVSPTRSPSDDQLVTNP